jgi:hypothetical protein
VTTFRASEDSDDSPSEPLAPGAAFVESNADVGTASRPRPRLRQQLALTEADTLTFSNPSEDEMCVLRLLLRGCRLSHASNVLVLAPGTTAKVEVLAGEHDAVYWPRLVPRASPPKRSSS